MKHFAVASAGLPLTAMGDPGARDRLLAPAKFGQHRF